MPILIGLIEGGEEMGLEVGEFGELSAGGLLFFGVLRAIDDDDVVGGGLLMLGEAIGFAEKAFGGGACDGVAYAFGHGEAEAVVGEGVGGGDEGEGAGVFAHFGCVNGGELFAA